jgi:hypothetical protein
MKLTFTTFVDSQAEIKKTNTGEKKTDKREK